MIKHHTQENRDYVVKLVIEEGRKISDLSYELEIWESSISRWVKAYKEKQAIEKGTEKYVTPSELKNMENMYEKSTVIFGFIKAHKVEFSIVM
ncbi:transposase [Viridibacillus sp. YIM B01967]|uniref:Transposase n=1 Tax=Viridibacillus soli TaxID=2798301 RepID=A0ABS1HA51_9BACL|nr:transposase [Viridibacillus soli]MBK3496285.1 transposase [Viridibacillus soli]